MSGWPHQLDANQVIQSVYDEANSALRVNTEATITGGAFEVAIDAATDSIRVSDGTDTLGINADGSINVNVLSVSSPVGNVKNIFNAITAVPSSSTTAITTYMIPALTTAYLERVEVSGTNIAQYDVYINSSIVARKRTYFGNSLSETFDFSSTLNRGLAISAGIIIEVRVTHTRPTVGDFEARIQLVEI